jgi:hypothetical protein
MDAAAGQHLLRQIRRDGVGNGVVDMEQVELVELGNLRHAGSQREIVGRMLEQRVVKHLDLVEVNIGLAARKAERCGRGDEVDVVATRCQLDAKLGGDHAAPSIGGVAGDADA